MKKEKILRILIIILLIIVLVSAVAIKNANNKPKKNMSFLKIKIIDKDNNMQKLYDNPEKEEYVLVDLFIDGCKYKDVGIRTKGSAIYSFLKIYNSDLYSFKVKLDYKNKNQNYKRNDRTAIK